jgi:hypothetical protein
MFRVEPCLLEEYISDTDYLCRVNLRSLKSKVRTVSDSKGHNYTLTVCGNLTSGHCGASGVGESVLLHSSTWNCFPNRTVLFLISNFYCVLNVVCFLLGNSPASEFYVPTLRNTLFHLHRRIGVIRL